MSEHDGFSVTRDAFAGNDFYEAGQLQIATGRTATGDVAPRKVGLFLAKISGHEDEHRVGYILESREEAYLILDQLRKDIHKIWPDASLN